MTIEVRAPRLDEVEALTELINRDVEELYGKPEETVETTRLWLTGPRLDPETDIRVAVVDGTFRGYVDIDPDPEPIYWVDIRVPPSERDDILATLLDWAENRARERAAGRKDALLRTFAASVDEREKGLLETRGYGLIRHFYRMRIDFEDELPEPEWPEGVTVRSATAAEGQTVHEVAQETFVDSWEHNEEPFEDWAHWMMREGFDPSLWFVAESAGEVAAVALCREHESEPGLGWVAVLGVRRPWRRRGVGRAALLHSFHEFRCRGFHAVALGVDAESLTGANRLYESAGMKVVRRSDVYEKAI